MTTRQTWKDRIKAVASATELTEPSPLVQTLEDFRATLDESPWIRAELKSGPHPRMRRLVVYPKYRRDISATMLNFWVDQDAVRVVGAEVDAFTDEEMLGGYLADFAEKSAFPSTVLEFRRIQDEPVHGTLRVRGLFDNDPEDVPVLVDAKEHNEMAKRVLDNETDTAFGLRAVIEEHPSRAKFDPATRYLFLESGGFGLRLAPGAVREFGKILHLHGDLVPLEALQT